MSAGDASGATAATRVGLVGCGALGRVLGMRLIEGGCALAVHDKDRARAASLLARGASWVDRASAIAPGSTLIISALPRPEDSESAVFSQALWSDAAPGTFHLETATVGVSCVRRLAAEASSRGIRFLDGPISRGSVTDRGPRTVMYVGADANHFDTARPILEALVDRVLYCGSVGKGQVTKLVNNLVAHALTVIVGEALAMGVRAGASVDLLRAALHEGTAQNRLLDDLLPASALRGDWRPGLRLSLAEKDIDLAVELAAEGGATLTGIDEIRELYRKAAARGWSELSAHAVLRLVEESTGISLLSPVFASLDPHRPPDTAAPAPDE